MLWLPDRVSSLIDAETRAGSGLSEPGCEEGVDLFAAVGFCESAAYPSVLDDDEGGRLLDAEVVV